MLRKEPAVKDRSCKKAPSGALFSEGKRKFGEDAKDLPPVCFRGRISGGRQIVKKQLSFSTLM
jgi:hypothetical protein